MVRVRLTTVELLAIRVDLVDDKLRVKEVGGVHLGAMLAVHAVVAVLPPGVWA